MSSQPFRPVRRQDIQFKRSLFRFTVVFSLVLVFGLVTRYSVSKIPIKEKIIQAAQLPQGFELVVDKPELRLKSGWLPVLGVSVNRLDVTNTNCPTQKLSAQDILLRVDPFALLVGKVELGVFDVDFFEVTFSKDCSVKTVTDIGNNVESIKKTIKKSQSSSKTKKEGLPDRWLKEVFPQVANFLKKPPIKKVRVNQFQVHYLESLDRQIKADGRLVVKMGQKMSANMDLKNIHVGKNDFSFVSTELGMTADPNELALEISSSVREGKFQLNFKVENKDGWPATLKSEVTKLPLSSLVSARFGKKELNYLWASGSLSMESPWGSLLERDLTLDGWKVDGPYGEVAFKNIQASLGGLQNLELELNKINLDKVLKDKRNLYFSGVFSKYGILSSKVAFKSGVWNVNGHLLGSEFIFSNNNLRDIQKVKKIPFRFKGNGKSWTSQLFDIELEEGQFAGELKLEGRSDGKSRGRVAIHRLKLNPRIYKLMINSKPSDLRLYGKFSASDKGLEEWSAMLATPRLDSDLYKFNNLKVKGSGGANKVAQLKLTVGDGSLNGNGPLFRWIQPTHLEKKWEYEKLQFKELSSRLELFKDRSLKWKRGYIHLNNGWQLSSEGERGADRIVKAWLQWDRPDRKYLRWNYQGPFFKGEWSPETPWVKEWLKEHPEFLKENDSVIFNVENEKSITDKLNQAGQKAIEKVKDALKGEASEKGS